MAENLTLAEARAHCLDRARRSRENFHVLSRFVPREFIHDVAAVYAFCRVADDLGDETGSDAAARRRSLALLADWRAGLEACFRSARGEASDPPHDPPAHPVFLALAETVRTRRLPERPFHDLIDAFEQDQRVTRYDTWDALADYCTRSANPVGRIVLHLAFADAESEAPVPDELTRMSDATCTALQLTNFWQDVRRDLLERDRVYVPRECLDVPPETLREWLDRPDDPGGRVAYIRALRPLCERTAALFDEGEALPGRLRQVQGNPARFAPVVWLFGAGGRTVLRSVLRGGCTTLWRRPTLTFHDRAVLLARAAAKFGLKPGA